VLKLYNTQSSSGQSHGCLQQPVYAQAICKAPLVTQEWTISPANKASSHNTKSGEVYVIFVPTTFVPSSLTPDDASFSPFLPTTCRLGQMTFSTLFHSLTTHRQLTNALVLCYSPTSPLVNNPNDYSQKSKGVLRTKKEKNQ